MTNFDDMLNVIARNSDPQQLEDLKKFFQEDISSPRLYASINSMQYLLTTLRNRGTFDEANIEALEVIADGMDNRTIHNVINQYVPVPVPEPEDLPNLYDLEMENDQLDIQRRLQHIHIGQNGDLPQRNDNQEERKKELVRRLVSRNIGHKCRAFGSAIGVAQGEMDELDLLHPHSIESRVRGMIAIIEEEERVDRFQWANVLCRALIDCRRADLEHKVREILARPNL